MCKIDVVCRSVVGHIQIVGLGRIFSSQRIDLFDEWRDATFFTVTPNLEHIGLDFVGFAVADGAS